MLFVCCARSHLVWCFIASDDWRNRSVKRYLPAAEDPDTPDMRSERPEEDRKATGRKAAETRAERYGDTTVGALAREHDSGALCLQSAIFQCMHAQVPCRSCLMMSIKPNLSPVKLAARTTAYNWLCLQHFEKGRSDPQSVKEDMQSSK